MKGSPTRRRCAPRSDDVPVARNALVAAGRAAARRGVSLAAPAPEEECAALCQRQPDEGRARARASAAASPPAALLPAGGDRFDHRDRPPLRGHYAPLAAADHHARDGRFAQHGCEGRRSQPPDRRAARRQVIRRRVSRRHAHRHRRVRRHGVARAVADAESRGSARGHRPVPAAARHRDRQCALRGARDALSGCRHRPRVARVQGRSPALRDPCSASGPRSPRWKRRN